MINPKSHFRVNDGENVQTIMRPLISLTPVTPFLSVNFTVSVDFFYTFLQVHLEFPIKSASSFLAFILLSQY